MHEPLKHWRYKSVVYNELTSKWEIPRRKKPLKDQCQSIRCKNYRKAEFRKGKFYLKPLCAKCYKRLSRINNRAADSYGKLKSHAKARNIPFTLTFSEFLVFCNETDYLNRRYDLKSNLLTIDRINPTEGYTFKNIQLLTLGDNVAKRNSFHENYHSSTSDDPF
jgi:hypothetical protein